jgi:hypothetical protein
VYWCVAVVVVKRLVALVLYSGLPLSFYWSVFADCGSNDLERFRKPCFECLPAMAGLDDRRALKARLGAARLVLEEYPKGSPSHKALSKAQSAALVEMLGAAVLTAVERADLANLVVAMSWCEPDDGNSVLAALTPVTSMLPPGKRRRTQQDFLAFCNFGTEELWSQLLGGAPASAKLGIALQWAIGLGLRCPTEHTMKWLCSVWLAVSQTEAELVVMEPVQKKHMFHHTKSVFDSLRKHAADPPVWIDKLPHNPVEFLRDFPDIFRLLYGGGAPVPVQADLLRKVTAFDMSYTCRGGARVVPSQLPGSGSSSSGGVMQVAVADSPMERIANLFMGRIDAMAGAQQRMMELMMGGGGMDRRGGMQPRSLAALANGDGFPPRRIPSIAFGNDSDSPPPGFRLALECETPPPAASLHSGSPPSVARAASAEEVAEFDATEVMREPQLGVVSFSNV